MTYNYVPFERTNGSYEDQMATLVPFRQALVQQALDPQGNDHRIAMAVIGIHSKLVDPIDPISEEFRGLVIDYLINPASAGGGEPKHAVMKAVRGIQSPLLKKEHRAQKGYPEKFTDPEQWMRAIDWIVSSDVLRTTLTFDWFLRRNEANKPGRYATILAATGLRREYQDRFTEPLRILDLGCSLNMGLGKIATGTPFGDIKVVQLGNPDIEDKAMTDKIQQYTRDYQLAEGVGVDITDHDRDQGKWWAMSCSGYPSEWLNPALEEEFAYIHEAEARPNVQRFRADIRCLGDLEALDLEEHSFDVVSVFTTLYEMPAKDRLEVWANADKYVKKGADAGLKIGQEFGVVDTLGRFNPAQNPFKGQFKYRTFVEDMAHRRPRKIPEFRWQNGRCKQLMLDVGARAVMGSATELQAA